MWDCPPKVFFNVKCTEPEVKEVNTKNGRRNQINVGGEVSHKKLRITIRI